MIKNEFVPRLIQPETDNKFFITLKKGGFNKAKAQDENGLVIPNDIGYVIGRWMETSNNPKNKLGLTDMWNKRDGYNRGVAPKVGAIACWANENSQHVGFVEEIKADGAVVFSNSGNKLFYIRELKAPFEYKGVLGPMKLVGFIYNDLMTEFAEEVVEPAEETKTLETLVAEVAAGEWGDGLERYRKINKAFKNGEIAFDYDTIQNELNK